MAPNAPLAPAGPARRLPGLGLLVALIVALGAAGAHRAQRAADAVRFGRDDPESWVHPDGEALRVAALGQHVLVSDVVWVRALLYFAEALDHPSELKRDWQRASLDAVVTLDPRWRTPYFYGGSFLRLLGDIDASDALLERGMRFLPADPYFPFSVGMNAFLYRKDPERAARFVTLAAGLPGAPEWYRNAAAGILDRSGQRRVALRYLQEQVEAETRPAAREVLLRKQRQLLHDELADQLNRARDTQPGAPLDALGPLPPDPFGETWIIAPDGLIRSAAVERVERARAQGRERDTVALPVAP
ncbi:MAG: hypothetical protein JNM72_05930 [Deltaproteobacteria bacterium]|nr:hypothetical protein [Deltaproteobacteria bacterium]